MPEFREMITKELIGVPLNLNLGHPEQINRCLNKAKVYFLIRTIDISIAGNKTRLVMVAVTSVRDVSQPRDCVPPKPLKQKMINPAMSTIEV